MNSGNSNASMCTNRCGSFFIHFHAWLNLNGINSHFDWMNFFFFILAIFREYPLTHVFVMFIFQVKSRLETIGSSILQSSFHYVVNSSEYINEMKANGNRLMEAFVFPLPFIIGLIRCDFDLTNVTVHFSFQFIFESQFSSHCQFILFNFAFVSIETVWLWTTCEVANGQNKTKTTTISFR